MCDCGSCSKLQPVPKPPLVFTFSRILGLPPAPRPITCVVLQSARDVRRRACNSFWCSEFRHLPTTFLAGWLLTLKWEAQCCSRKTAGCYSLSQINSDFLAVTVIGVCLSPSPPLLQGKSGFFGSKVVFFFIAASLGWYGYDSCQLSWGRGVWEQPQARGHRLPPFLPKTLLVFMFQVNVSKFIFCLW